MPLCAALNPTLKLSPASNNMTIADLLPTPSPAWRLALNLGDYLMTRSDIAGFVFSSPDGAPAIFWDENQAHKLHAISRSYGGLIAILPPALMPFDATAAGYNCAWYITIPIICAIAPTKGQDSMELCMRLAAAVQDHCQALGGWEQSKFSDPYISSMEYAPIKLLKDMEQHVSLTVYITDTVHHKYPVHIQSPNPKNK